MSNIFWPMLCHCRTEFSNNGVENATKPKPHTAPKYTQYTGSQSKITDDSERQPVWHAVTAEMHLINAWFLSQFLQTFPQSNCSGNLLFWVLFPEKKQKRMTILIHSELSCALKNSNEWEKIDQHLQSNISREINIFQKHASFTNKRKSKKKKRCTLQSLSEYGKILSNVFNRQTTIWNND